MGDIDVIRHKANLAAATYITGQDISYFDMIAEDTSQLFTGLLAATLAVTLLNTGLILTGSTGNRAGTAPPASEASFELPNGTPSYASKLGVSFDSVSPATPQKAQETIRRLAAEDSRNLDQRTQDRMIHILYKMNGGISCEYCCGARSVVTRKGTGGCGCSHAVAMRGLTKYLLQETSMTNTEIFQEVAKWKTRFFPDQSKAKFRALQQRGTEPSFINLASNEYRGIATGKGGWVGDC